MGLLAGDNDMALLARTDSGRDINRHYFQADEINLALQKPVVKDLFALIKFRNSYPAFNGRMTLLETGEDELAMRWSAGTQVAELRVDFSRLDYRISYNTADGLAELAFLSSPQYV